MSHIWLMIIYILISTVFSIIGMDDELCRFNCGKENTTMTTPTPNSVAKVSQVSASSTPSSSSGSSTQANQISDTPKSSGNNFILIGGIALGSVSILVLIVSIYKKRRNNKKTTDFGLDKPSSPCDEFPQWKEFPTSYRNVNSSQYSPSSDTPKKSIYDCKRSKFGESVFRSQQFDFNSTYMRSDSTYQ